MYFSLKNARAAYNQSIYYKYIAIKFGAMTVGVEAYIHFGPNKWMYSAVRMQYGPDGIEQRLPLLHNIIYTYREIYHCNRQQSLKSNATIVAKP